MREFHIQISHPQGTYMIGTRNAAYGNLLCDRAIELGWYATMRVTVNGLIPESTNF